MGQYPLNTNSTTTAMNSLVFVATLALASCSPVEVVSSDLKAASPLTNCGCQCSSLTFVDSAGHVQGNCKSVDSTGARWCYIDPSYGTSCQDLTPSARFPANPWSYEACATPTIGSSECPAAVAPATVVVSAPSDNHIHVPVVTTPVQVSAPHVSVVDHDHHVHVTAPVVIAHDPVHTHFDRNEIPQGPYLAPIPKKAAEPDTAFPTK